MVLVAEERWRCGVDVASPQLLDFSLRIPLLQRMEQLTSWFSACEVCTMLLSVCVAPHIPVTDNPTSILTETTSFISSIALHCRGGGIV